MKIILYGILLFILSATSYGQDCTDYHQFQCTYADYTFFYSRQSKSLLFYKGQTSELKIVAYEGEEYYVSVCAARKLGKIRFRILNDDDSGSVLYDNADNDYQPSITFSNESTTNLIIEVSTVESSTRETKDTGCLGVVIQFRKTSK